MTWSYVTALHSNKVRTYDHKLDQTGLEIYFLNRDTGVYRCFTQLPYTGHKNQGLNNMTKNQTKPYQKYGTWWSGPLLHMACTSQPWFLFQFQNRKLVHSGLCAM